MNYFEIAVRFFLSYIDRIISWVIVQAYNLFKLIADVGIFNEAAFQMFNRRIYALLSIFMLFKLAFSLITYIVNPDTFSDKSKGFGKLVTNVFVTLILLVSVPTIFSAAYDLQGIVIEDNTIPKLILGVNATNQDANVSSGDVMAFSVYSAFMPLNPDFPGITDECQKLYSVEGFDTYDANCKSAITSVLGSKSEKFFRAISNYNAWDLLSPEFINAHRDGTFLFGYRPIISIICGGLVAWILLMFCIDIAVRVVKLGFLQLIAPIPIISYIDPQGSKDGMFKKWTKTSISTYADIFIRLLAISFAIFIINIICTSKMIKLSTGKEMMIADTGIFQYAFVQILIILGALLFAKQIPKLIEDITGIKLGGTFTLNPMRKINEAPILGKAAAFAGGALSGAVAGHRVGSTMRGAVAGAFMGGKAVPFMGSKDGKAAFTSGANAAYKQLMGKDYVTFSPEKLLLTQGVGKKAVEEVKTPIKNAYSRLNELNTQLNVTSHSSAEEASKLRTHGVDIKNLGSEKGRLSAQSGAIGSKGAAIKSKLSEVNSRLQTTRKEYESAKSSLDSGILVEGTKSYNDIKEKVSRFEQEFKQLENESKTLTANYNSVQNELNTVNGLMSSIDRYESLSAEETALRKDISKVEKAIKDLSSEKSQRERFYNYDPAPTEDVNKLIGDYDPNSRQAQQRKNKNNT